MRRQPKAYLALLFVCIAWGTTYLAIKLAVTDYPAFLFAGVRQVVAGIIIMGLAMLRSRRMDFSWSSIWHQMLVGFLMITVGNGLVSWAERFVPSGVAALICGMMPICAVILNVASSKKEKLNLLIIAGLVLGFGGVALKFKDNLKDITNGVYLAGILGLFCATTSWALGSIVNKRRTKQVNPVFNSGLQLFFGGSFLLCGSPVFDNYAIANFASTSALLSLIYLIVVGSILAYTAYMYALKELPVGLVTIYAYVNPLVAVLLGYWWLGEPLTWYTGLSFLCIILGVYLVNHGHKRQRKQIIFPPAVVMAE